MMAEKSDGCRSRNKMTTKVGPLPDAVKEIHEIRPKRKLRIRHLNPRPRDESFLKELKVFLDNIRSAAITPRVVTVPRLNVNRNVELSREKINGNASRSDTNHNFSQLPNMTTHSNGNFKPDELTAENVKLNNDELLLNTRPLSNKDPSDLHSESRASVFSTGETSVMSASNVDVAVDNKIKPTNIPSVIAETDEPMSSRSSHSVTMQNGLPQSNLSSQRTSNQNIHMGKNTDSSPKPTQSLLSPRKSILKKIHAVVKPITDKECVLFFIHGVGGSSDIWKAQMEYFEKLDCEIICLDLIGHGLSDAPDNKAAYTFDQILLDVQELFDKYCKRRNIIVGHSYGCAFATVLARERRKWVSKLVLVSGGGPTPLAPQPGVFSLPLCLLACCRPCLNNGFQRGAFHSNFKNKSEKQKAFDVPSYVLSYVMNGQFWPDGDDLYHSCINVPTLLVYGKEDGLIDIEEEEEMMKTIYESRLEIVENAGHMVMMETPDRFNQLLYNFITDQPLDTMHTDLDTHRTDIEDEYIHTRWPNVDDEYSQLSHQAMVKSQVSLHSIRSCKSTKSMPHGLLSSSVK